MPETVLDLDQETAERLRRVAPEGQDSEAAIRGLLERVEQQRDQWPASDYY